MHVRNSEAFARCKLFADVTSLPPCTGSDSPRRALSPRVLEFPGTASFTPSPPNAALGSHRASSSPRRAHASTLPYSCDGRLLDVMFTHVIEPNTVVTVAVPAKSPVTAAPIQNDAVVLETYTDSELKRLPALTVRHCIVCDWC